MRRRRARVLTRRRALQPERAPRRHPPPTSGRAHLARLVERGRSAAGRCELVALTRDPAEERLVAGTGIERVLRKPFAPGAVERVARSLAEGTPSEGRVHP